MGVLLRIDNRYNALHDHSIPDREDD